MDFDDLDELGGRANDIIIYGATGTVGDGMCAHLDALCAAGRLIRWGVAGRNKEKLEKVKGKYSSATSLFCVNTPEEIEEMAAETKVVCLIVAPFLIHGEPVVKACVEKGTHCLDISGEVVWITRMVKKYHAAAKEKGVMIVNGVGVMCGAEDVAMSMLAAKLGPLASFKEYGFAAGLMGGGTCTSSRAEMELLDNEDLKAYKDPYILSVTPADGARKRDQDQEEAVQDDDFPSVWLMPHHSGHYANRSLRRTCMLFEQSTSNDDETAKALVKSSDLTVLVADAAFDESQAQRQAKSMKRCSDIREAGKRHTAMEEALKRGQHPKPGQGPSKEARAMCMTKYFCVAQGKNGEWAHVLLSGPESGYDLTAMLCVHGALALVEEEEAIKPQERGGVLTPAFAFHGSNWIEEMAKRSFAEGGGLKPTFEVIEGKPSQETVINGIMAVSQAQGAVQAAIAAGEVKALVDYP